MFPTTKRTILPLLLLTSTLAGVQTTAVELTADALEAAVSCQDPRSAEQPPAASRASASTSASALLPSKDNGSVYRTDIAYSLTS
ncbi:MAG: hypothetical protein U0U25_03805 [Flavobacteriales bacterium]